MLGRSVRYFRFVLAALLALPAIGALAAPSASEIVEHYETTIWGKTLRAVFEMTLVTPSWSRTLTMNVTMDRPTKSFVRITAPAKDTGILSLRVGSDMWNYMPAIERVVKIPPSMMSQPWLGSDFSNDDMVKEGSLVTDYTHRMVGERMEGAAAVYEVELLPKPGAAVVWGKINMIASKDNLLPLKVRFFNERNEAVRTLTYTELRKMGGRVIPTRWEMQPADQPGKSTTLVVKSAEYDRPVPADTFSMQNLGRRR
ncbi:outer membrane lipoprotein-sorting protein [Pseudoduganella namucuonensis]|uniref:Outer membrane lipoprotein-sorting protein n=1 Tax=Pseudoduganella namucuonensis TaxID=1035707 RepID=A0A1I7FKJ7_9BURK|nr:outer membrane lipoprotein-sorting protein [Pseudoduganella namucuonensis]SFU36668.1 outer membrane lipoprotein-sorting protein [Pseudoduganella namucuonensis]